MAKNSERRDLFPGALEIMILQSLRLQPMHGYALVKHIKLVSDDLLQVEEGSLYPALHRMDEAGWIKSEWAPSENNRRARYYKITAAGRRRLVQEEADWHKEMDAIMRVLRLA